MIGEDWPVVGSLLGLGEPTLDLLEMALRAVVVYIAAIMMLRLGQTRFLGKYTALDVILGFMLGSILSRAITGNSPFFETLGAAIVLVSMHWLLAASAYRWSAVGTLVKGRKKVLVRDGEIQWDAMRSSHISEHDLMGALRSGSGIEDLHEVKTAWIERSGNISAVRRERAPRVVEVQVRDGVQTVRVELD